LSSEFETKLGSIARPHFKKIISIELPYDSVIPLLDTQLRELIFVDTHVHSSIIYNRQKVDTKDVCINEEWISKNVKSM
jgi:hypothetical protein